jgi:DNA-binding response OmpR family regulator
VDLCRSDADTPAASPARARGRGERAVVDIVMPTTPLGEALRDRLRGHGVVLVPDVSFIEAARSLSRGVVVVQSPPADGTVIRAVAAARRRRSAMRALLASAPEQISERLDALADGFDDAVPSSMDALEIAGRIIVLRERCRRGARTSIRVADGVVLDLGARVLRRDGRVVHLRPLELRLLEELARHAGRPVSRAALLRRVWGGQASSGSRTVDVHIRWLREKLEPRPEAPVHLLTVRGFGYQLEPDAPPEP